LRVTRWAITWAGLRKRATQDDVVGGAGDFAGYGRNYPTTSAGASPVITSRRHEYASLALGR